MADGRKYQWLESVMGSKLSNRTKCVGWALFKHANTKTLYCYPNLTRIDLVLGGSGSGKNMHRHIQSLLESGFIVKHQMKVGHYMSNGYLLVTPAPPDDLGAPHDEEGSPQDDLKGSQGDGLTLSRTLSDISLTDSFNEKPSASEIQEDEEVKEESSIQSSWLSTVRPNAALPPCAEDEDFLAEVERLLDGPASQDAASPQDVLSAIKKMGDEVFTSDSFFPDCFTRQHAASPPIAEMEHQLSWAPRNDEIPNEEW